MYKHLRIPDGMVCTKDLVDSRNRKSCQDYEGLIMINSSKVQVYTDDWGPEKYQVKTLRYSLVTSEPYPRFGSEYKTLIEIDIESSTCFQLSLFFREVAKLAIKHRQESETSHVQFTAVLEDGEEMPMKWFWIKAENKKFSIGHDMAFDTVLVKKHYGTFSIKIPLGQFSRKRKMSAKYAYANNKRDAYKCISNMLR